jgi:hypothetical protein
LINGKTYYGLNKLGEYFGPSLNNWFINYLQKSIFNIHYKRNKNCVGIFIDACWLALLQQLWAHQTRSLRKYNSKEIERNPIGTNLPQHMDYFIIFRMRDKMVQIKTFEDQLFKKSNKFKVKEIYPFWIYFHCRSLEIASCFFHSMIY